MKFYSPIDFSPHIKKTPEGFLVCEAVAIARAGELEYGSWETPIEPDNDGRVRITRSESVLMETECLASFEGKPITLNHPPDFVTPDTFKQYAVGVVQNVRVDHGQLLADLVIMDARAIEAIEAGEYRQLSCGYEADYQQIERGRGIQTKIIGNHVALVSHGRCGASCAIFDEAPKKSEVKMKQKLLGLLGRAVDEALPDEQKAADLDTAQLGEMLQNILARLDALEAKAAETTAVDEQPTDEQSADAGEPVDEQPTDEQTDAGEPVDVNAKLAAMESMLSEILAAVKTTADEDAEKAAENTFDQATLAAGEILAPELKPCKDYTARALDSAYSTKDGRSVITSLLGGRSFDSAKGDTTLFLAAAELLKAKRRGVLDGKPQFIEPMGVVTPERINELNSTFFNGR